MDLLDQVAVGSRVMVVAIASDQETQVRLASRGVVPGAELTLMRQGDPCLVAIDRSRWALGRREAHAVSVVPCQCNCGRYPC